MIDDVRTPNPRLAGPGRVVYVASALALTEPGPAGAGLVIADERGRTLAHRSHYLGRVSRAEAGARAMLEALHLAELQRLEAPLVRTDDAPLLEALNGDPGEQFGPGSVGAAIGAVLGRLPGHRLEYVRPSANLARPIALAPLVEWLPERTRRAEGLHVKALGEHTYEVGSATQPGQVYRVVLGPGHDGDGDPLQCECADFQYRAIPCKHLLAVAREEGTLDRLFYTPEGERNAA